MLFSLKNCKNRQSLGSSASRPTCLRRLGASYATDYGNYNHRFQLFRFVLPSPIHFALAPPLMATDETLKSFARFD